MEILNLLTKISSSMIKIRFISKILSKKSKFSVSSYEALVKTRLQSKFFCIIWTSLQPYRTDLDRFYKKSESCIYIYIYVYICLYIYIYIYQGVAKGTNFFLYSVLSSKNFPNAMQIYDINFFFFFKFFLDVRCHSEK